MSLSGTLGRKASGRGASYYDEVFAFRDQGPAIPESAGVYVELRTNVILQDEFGFAKSISEMIAQRYARPETNVCVSISPSACMIMGGTFEGTYVITITSVSLVSPTVNKRNAALISEWLDKNLGVPPHRGYIRFVDPDFANFTAGGYTMQDLMEKEELARTGRTQRSGVYRERSIKSPMSWKRRSSRSDTPSDTISDIPETPEDSEPPVRLRSSRSVLNIFSRRRAGA